MAASPAITVQESFDTSSYFKDSCTAAAPRRFTVTGVSASLEALVEGEWFRLMAKAKDGTSLKVHGPFVLRGRDARIDQQPGNLLQVEAVASNGMKVEDFTVPYSLQDCTCVSYDSV